MAPVDNDVALKKYAII